MRQASGGLPGVLIALDIGCLVCLFLSMDKAAADGVPPPSQDTMSSQEAWCPLQAQSGFALPSPGPYGLQGHMPRGLASIEEGGRPLAREPGFGFQFSSFCPCDFPISVCSHPYTHSEIPPEGMARDGTVSAFKAQAS